MKLWKKYTITSALVGVTGGVGVSHYLASTDAPAKISPDFVVQIGYFKGQQTDTSKLEEAARRLHARIRSGVESPDAASEAIYDNAKAPYRIVRTDISTLEKSQEEYAKAVGKKLNYNDDMYGQLTIATKQSWVYKKVEQALALYNAKYPDAKVQMPRFVALRKEFANGGGYNPNKDLLFIEEKTLSILNDEELLAVIAHELAHKAQAYTPVANWVNRNFKEDIGKTEPLRAESNSVAFKRHSALIAEVNTGRKAFPAFGKLGAQLLDYNQTEITGLPSLTLNRQSCKDGDDYNGLRTVPISQVIADIHRAESKKIEFVSDFSGAEAVSPRAMANAILKLYYHLKNSKLENYAQDDNSLHPNDEERVKALHCKPVKSALDNGKRPSFVALCENTGDKSPKITR